MRSGDDGAGTSVAAHGLRRDQTGADLRLAAPILRTLRQPLLVLNAELRVEMANPAFCLLFGIEDHGIEGRQIHELGNGQWGCPELRASLGAVRSRQGPVVDYRIEHEFEPIGRRVLRLNACPMPGAEHPREIMLTIEDVTEIERAQELLAGEKGGVGQSFDASRDALVILDFDLRVKSANDTFYRAFGLDPATTPGRRVYELGEGQWDAPQLRDLLANALPANGAFDHFEVHHDIMDFGRRTMMLSARRIDQMKLILLAIAERTGAPRSDDGPLVQAPPLQRVPDSLLAFVTLLTPDGVVRETNRPPAGSAGIEWPDVRGRRFEDCPEWSHSAPVQARLREAITQAARGTMVRYDVEMQVPGGRMIAIDFMIAPLRDGPGDITGLVASAVDVTERKRLTEERLQAFLDISPDALILLHPDGAIRSVNVQAERLFGYSRDELVGRPVACLLPERYRTARGGLPGNVFSGARARATGADEEICALTRDAREIPLEISCSPISMPEGALILASVRDISARKEVEQALRASKLAAEAANALKSSFVAAVSHDLRQPLHTITLLGSVLAKKAKDEASLKVLRQLNETVAAMGNVVDSLLDVDQLDNGKVKTDMTVFPIQRLLDRLDAHFGCAAEVRGLTLRVAPCAATVCSDPQLLERLVGNLISNAIKYTESPGRILVGCRRRGDALRIDVRDTGIGIPSDQQQRIFDDYYRLSPAGERDGKPGLGLGLAIVKRLSAILQHRVEVCSEPGRGSRFSVELPLADADRRSGPRPDAPN